MMFLTLSLPHHAFATVQSPDPADSPQATSASGPFQATPDYDDANSDAVTWVTQGQSNGTSFTEAAMTYVPTTESNPNDAKSGRLKVPEPAALVLLGTALLTVAGKLRGWKTSK